MSENISGAVKMPWKRDHPAPFDPPEELGRLHAQSPITRLAFPDGHLGWLVTGHTMARKILIDPRFSARQELRHVPLEFGFVQQTMVGPARPGFFLRMDAPEHTKYRRLLTGQFTVRRMKQLTPRIEQLAEEHLDAMEKAGPPADLVEAYTLPIPSLMICELLGVPNGDRELFQHHTTVALNMDSTPQEIGATLRFIDEYLHKLVSDKRTSPTDDMLSGLIAAGELSDEEVMGIALMFMPGHEATANMLGLGAYALLCHPEQLAALQAKPSLIDNGIEELLRYLSVVNAGLSRAATEDVDLDGHVIKAGETVVISPPAVNRDPERFDDPDTLDVTRSASGHMTFGHGAHQCLGQQLARIEMRIAFPALFRRFPNLRLAIPAEEVSLRTEMAVHGVDRLPVTW